MTAHVLTQEGTAPGKGGFSEVRGLGTVPTKVAVFDYNMGTDNYAVNGNDISTLWTAYGFKDIYYIGIEQMDTSTAADRREFAVDYTAKTLIQYDAFNTEETASDQGVVTVRLLVVGI